MIEMENLVRDFLNSEELSLKNTLAYGGIGLSKTSGQICDIVSGVGFAGQQYSTERQTRVAEILGEMLFHVHVIASTIDMPISEISQQYINSYLAIQKTDINIVNEKEDKITLQDMMDMKKHVKAEAIIKLNEKHRASDNNEKRKQREDLMEREHENLKQNEF